MKLQIHSCDDNKFLDEIIYVNTLRLCLGINSKIELILTDSY